ncbi:MAG: RidA family protein [Betaproteobacteria bacterium]|nr:RidA family protein [Betaproteobacteria bacterium]
MSRRLVSSGSTFEKEIGYSRAVVDGDWIFVSGTTGFDYATMTLPESAAAQCEQCLKNIAAALGQASATLKDIVRVRYILSRREDFEQCKPILGRYLGDVRPAATMLVAGLLEERIRIEIEATALRRH